MEVVKTFLILTISVAKSQHWFAATDRTNEHAAAASSLSNYPQESFVHYGPNVQDEGDRYLPIFDNRNNVVAKANHTLIRKSNKNSNLKVNGKHSETHNFNQSQAVDHQLFRLRQANSTNLKFFRGIRRRKCPAAVSKLNSFRSAKSGEGKSRFLEVFHVVNIENVACSSSSGLEGTCMHQYECEASGGVAMGGCADGYGSCCVQQTSCGDATASAAVWFTNPGFPAPSAERLSCALTVDKTSKHIRQIRLDLMTFELLPPTEGSCELDQFMVSGHNINSFVPILCGINNGQHLYIEVGDVPGPIYLSVQTVTGDSRLFAIKVTQLRQSDVSAAPPGCLQHYTGRDGFLESFNYQDKSALALPKNPSYLNNMNYGMCIERAPEVCSITYTNVDVFQIPNYDSDGLPVIPAEQAGVEIFNCPADWLTMAAARLCGERLNDGSVLQDFSMDAPVTDTTAGPIAVRFRSDGGSVGRGFRLQYTQNACTRRRHKRHTQRVGFGLGGGAAGRTVAWTIFVAVWQVISAFLKFIVIIWLNLFR